MLSDRRLQPLGRLCALSAMYASRRACRGACCARQAFMWRRRSPPFMRRLPRKKTLALVGPWKCDTETLPGLLWLPRKET